MLELAGILLRLQVSLGRSRHLAQVSVIIAGTVMLPFQRPHRQAGISVRSTRVFQILELLPQGDMGLAIICVPGILFPSRLLLFRAEWRPPSPGR